MKDKTDAPATPAITPEALAEALKQLSPEQLDSVLKRSDAVPTTAGFSPEQIHTLIMTSGAANARAMQLALRRENPNYPERSVFNPTGVFDDDGNQLEPKVKLKRETFFVGVRLTGELETPDEIALFNRFETDRDARNGRWTARITKNAGKERLTIEFPHRNTDERMNLPGDMTLILRELLLGEEAVNPATMTARIDAQNADIEALKAQIAELTKKAAA